MAVLRGGGRFLMSEVLLQENTRALRVLGSVVKIIRGVHPPASTVFLLCSRSFYHVHSLSIVCTVFLLCVRSFNNVYGAVTTRWG